MTRLARIDRWREGEGREVILSLQVPNVLGVIRAVMREDVLILHRSAAVMMKRDSEARCFVGRTMRALERQPHHGTAIFEYEPMRIEFGQLHWFSKRKRAPKGPF